MLFLIISIVLFVTGAFILFLLKPKKTFWLGKVLVLTSILIDVGMFILLKEETYGLLFLIKGLFVVLIAHTEKDKGLC